MKQKRLILFTRPISPPWDEGSKNFAYSLAKHLNTPQIKICLLTSRKKIASLPRRIKQIPLHPNSEFDWRAKLRLLKFLVATDAEVIHFLFVPIFTTSLVIRLIKSWKRFKALQTIVSLETKNPYLLQQMIYGDQIICFTKKTASQLSSAGITNLQIIPPGVDLQVFKPKRKKNVIAFLGELHRPQSFKIVLEMIPRFLKAFPSYQLVLGFRTSVKFQKETRLVNKLKDIFRLERRVSFVDTINNMPDFLGKTKLVLYPARRTQGKFDLPLALIEALASGTPIVISPINPLTDFFGHRGAYAPSQNTADSFVEATKKVLSSDYNQSAKEARRTAEEFFDIQKIAQKYQKIYENL